MRDSRHVRLMAAPNMGRRTGLQTDPAMAEYNECSPNNQYGTMTEKIRKTDEEWRAELTPEQYRITRKKGTEPAFTGRYNASKEPGLYRCVCCGNPLFDSDDKFDSGTGWPSFTRP